MHAKATGTLFVVQAEPPAAREAEFHRWYDTVHGPDALGNGSFTALRRYRAAGPGKPFAPFLALWEGDYANEAEAWGYIRPRAHGLHAAGRVDDIASVRFALMTFLADAQRIGDPRTPVRCLTTVQNDWRRSDTAEPAKEWWARMGLADAPPSLSRYLYSSDPAGRGAGFHLALFEQAAQPAEAAAAWAGFGTAGSSPTPPYRTIFQAADAAPAAAVDTSDTADAWVMHWEPIAALP